MVARFSRAGRRCRRALRSVRRTKTPRAASADRRHEQHDAVDVTAGVAEGVDGPVGHEAALEQRGAEHSDPVGSGGDGGPRRHGGRAGPQHRDRCTVELASAASTSGPSCRRTSRLARPASTGVEPDDERLVNLPSTARAAPKAHHGTPATALAVPSTGSMTTVIAEPRSIQPTSSDSTLAPWRSRMSSTGRSTITSRA